MRDRGSGSPRWNLFARELEEILDSHGLRLGQLDDRAGIHREKVRRLRRSLITPKSFPTLNPDEMDQVIAACGLNAGEIVRLRAAILATAVEALLMDRIHPYDALLAAEQLLPSLLSAVRNSAQQPVGMGAFRGGSKAMSDEELVIDPAIELALMDLDRAILTLHLSIEATTNADHFWNARLAKASFVKVLQKLRSWGKGSIPEEIWAGWTSEAEYGRQLADKILTDLGE